MACAAGRTAKKAPVLSITDETYRAICRMTPEAMSRYLYTVYCAGYAEGIGDRNGEKLGEIYATLAEKLAGIRRRGE